MKYIANPVEVEAFKIVHVQAMPDAEPPLARRIMTEDGASRFAASEKLSRYIPVPGDYWVVQADGYEYLNPKDVFERKYHVDEKQLAQQSA